MKFENCTAVKCIRQSVGKKEYYQYTIEEECEYAKRGLCTYKRHTKIERKPDVREPEPAGK